MTAYYNEIDPHAAQWLRNLIADGIIAPGDVDERDIRDVVPSDLRGYVQAHFFAGVGVWSGALRQAGWSDDRPVWTGSCPCQPFSAAGSGIGFADERHVWPYWHHLIRTCRPSIVFGEQVASPNGLAWLDLVQDDLEGEDFAVWAHDLCAAGFGSPNIRQRLWWFAESMADAAGGRCGEFGSQAHPRRERHADGGCEAGKLADANGERHNWRGTGGPSDGRDTPRLEPQRLFNAGVVADTDELVSVEERLQRGGQFGGAGSNSRDRPWDEGQAGPINGFWRASDWLYCRDRKWRPVEAGTFPLVDGAQFGVGSGGAYEGQSRTGMLRGYGNAINKEAAAEFIAAVASTQKLTALSADQRGPI